MAPLARDILRVAASQIGVSEYPATSNKTKYGEWFGWNGVAWCNIFTSWVAWKCQALAIIPKTASTVTAANWYKQHNLYKSGASDLKPGDQLFFKFYGDRIHHTGWFEKWDGDYAITIEGNTSTGDNRNGGMVMRRRRNVAYIVGRGRPRYTPVLAATVINAPNRGLPIRGARSTKAVILRYVANGKRVIVYSKTATWSYIEYGGKSGYVPTKYLEF